MPNKLPLNWCVKSFKDSFVSISLAYKVKQKEYNEFGSYPIIDQGEEFIGGYTDSNKGLISDIPIIAFGDHTRRFKYIDFAFIAGADGLKIYKPIYTDVKFSYYQCLSLDFPNKGYARHNALLQKCDFKIPPLAEQERIVEKIEALFAGIDEGVEHLKSAQAQIKQYRQSVLKSAFEGKLYKTTDWKEVQLKDVCDINPKTELPSISDTEFVSFLPMTNVEAETCLYNAEKVEYSKVKKGYTKFQNKDILFAKITPCMENGKGCIVDNLIKGVGFGSTEFHVLRSSGKILPNLLIFFVLSLSFRKEAKAHMTGAVGQQRVPADFIKNHAFSLPTLPEQQRIVEEIEKRFAVADVLEKAVNEGLEKADKLKQSILKKAFEGKLAPQNPNDEPASVLLERIKKSQTPTKGKNK